ncbi:hypothetical protein ACFWP2_24565 [Kitasatospora sp. NPDC058444]|uniref:hypothetical protein n=1 Tax=Kitasatospora sp. NPDC058444 TaxID=3346504 RepID=UPI00365527D3
MIAGHGERRRTGRPQFVRAGDARDAWGSATAQVPAGPPVNVSTMVSTDNSDNNNVRLTTAWTSYAST